MDVWRGDDVVVVENQDNLVRQRPQVVQQGDERCLHRRLRRTKQSECFRPYRAADVIDGVCRHLHGRDHVRPVRGCVVVALVQGHPRHNLLATDVS
jgi:hypothetical protein